MMRAAFPLPDTAWDPTRPYWEAAARGELSLPRCDGCGRYRWYPVDTCRYCQAAQMTWVTAQGIGTLFAWVVVTHPFLTQFASKVPFITGLVALDEDPAVRLPTEIVDADISELRFDMPTQVTFRPIRFDGVEGFVVAPLWRPAG